MSRNLAIENNLQNNIINWYYLIINQCPKIFKCHGNYVQKNIKYYFQSRIQSIARWYMTEAKLQFPKLNFLLINDLR